MGELIRRRAGEEHASRSRSSILKENELRRAIKKIKTAQAITERRIREGEQRVSRLTRAVVLEGQETMRGQLDDTMQDVANQHSLIKSCQVQQASTEAEIESLTPTPEQGATRQHQQEQFRGLVNKRLEKDRQADQLLKELRRVLHERSQLTVGMQERVAALELTISDDGLDRRRFEKLLDSLPDEVLSQSEKWCGWFLGEQKDANSYVVRVEGLLVPETLEDNGLYHFGDLIYLNEEHARDLLCDDYFAGTPQAPWRCQSPKVMTVEAYEAAAKTARQKGLSIQEVCFWMDVERDAKNKQWFKDNGSRRTMHRRAVSGEDNTLFENTVKIRVKYKGETMEMAREQDAWGMVDDGSSGPP
jgi:hypothetical protein